MNRLRRSLLPVAFVAALHPSSGFTQAVVETAREEARQSSRDTRSLVFGHPAGPEQVDRVIQIRKGQRFVNVTNGETVLFKVNGKSFTWRFSRSLMHRRFALKDIAPREVDVPDVDVYCIPDLYERAG